MVEASYLLSSGAPEEYVALFYAVVLYGAIGVGIGGGCGVGVVVLDFLLKKVLKKSGVSNPYAFTLPFLGVVSALGLVITLYYLNKVVYGETGVPGGAKIKVLALFGTIGLAGLWLGPIFLTRTPFKVLMRLRGTVAMYTGLLLLSGIFAFAPADGQGDGPMAGDKAQNPELSERPNVLFIMIDTLRWDYLGSYDESKPDISPHLDALAADSVLYENAFAAASWTRSSIASFFTSMVPLSHTAELKDSALPDEVDTMAEVLQAHGYHTGGLPNNINVTRNYNFDQGFDYFSYQAPEFPLKATESAFQLSMYQLVRKIREGLVSHKRVEEFYQPAPTVLGNTQEFIEAQGDNRWFAYVHLMEPHDPYFERPYNGVGYGRAENEVPDPEKWKAGATTEELVEYLQQVYSGEITAMDKDLGVFFDWMKEQGVYDNTVIVISSDHGEEFFEHGGWWHGTTLFEEQIHVPLILKLPNQELAGSRVPWQVRAIDVAPTLAELAGAPVSPMWQGTSLVDDSVRKGLEILTQQAAALAADAAADAAEGAAEELEDAGAEAEEEAFDLSSLERLVYAQEDFEGYVLEAVRAKGWKFIAASNPEGAGQDGDTRRVLPERSLFDMSGFSPDEQNNQAGMGLPVQGELENLARESNQTARDQAVGEMKTEATASEEERMRALGYIE